MKQTCYNIYLLIYHGYDSPLPVHPTKYPEGLEDNYAFTDGQCDWEWGIVHSLKENRQRKRNPTLLGIRTLMTTGVTQIQVPL